jgi:hypothetical protein
MASAPDHVYPTANLRIVVRDGRRELQQLWVSVSGRKEGRDYVLQTEEWRAVPVVVDEG